MHLLVTGASGKLGGKLLVKLLDTLPNVKITAMTHSRDIAVSDGRVRVVKGDISSRAVRGKRNGGRHACRAHGDLQGDPRSRHGCHGQRHVLDAGGLPRKAGDYFILVGGDAAIGHFAYPARAPLTEATPHRAAPGCYSLSKVLEEVMLTQAHIQYGIQGCCLRAPWIMADDDLKYALTFSPDVFGVPRWHDEVGRRRQHFTRPSNACRWRWRPTETRSSAALLPSTTSSTPSLPPSNSNPPVAKPSTSPWTSRSITATPPLISSVASGRMP